MENEAKVLEGIALELRYLSESWRNKATGLEMRHGKTHPNATKNMGAVYENCADEIDAVVAAIQTKIARLKEKP